jgi:anaerobic magnesium-protoporphyrin IX monomethyl ester cyclase
MNLPIINIIYPKGCGMKIFRNVNEEFIQGMQGEGANVLELQKRYHIGKKPKKVMLVVMPYEGEVRDDVTEKFFKNKAVKYMPLGVLSIAACIPDIHEVKVLDASSLGLTIDETIEEIESFGPDILGLSVVTYRAWQMTEILNRTTAPFKAVGGPHTTHNYMSIAKQGADAIFVGDAEITFAKWIGDGCPSGIFFGNAIALDSLPLPARELVNLRDYEIGKNNDLLFDVGKLRLPMYSSKGCPLKCVYCDVQQKSFNFKSPEKCVEEFQELVRLGVTSIHILDDAFNIRKKRIMTMSKLIVEADITIDWSARGTVEVRESLIEALAMAGCKRLHVGIEAIDDGILEYFKKSCRLRDIERFAKLCNKYGISILGYFIIGAPSSVESLAYRQELPYRIEELGIPLPFFNVLTPLNETPLYYGMLKSGQIPYDYWKKFCETPTKDWLIPRYHRSDEEEVELRKIVDGYVDYFFRKRDSMLSFVS